MTETKYYKLKKAGANEAYTVEVPNANTDALDAALHGLETGKAGLDPATGKVKEEQLPNLDYIPTKEKGAPKGVATLDADGKVPKAQVPGGLADEAVAAHNTSEDPHANMGFLRAVDAELTDPLPINADTLEGKTKAQILGEMDASLAADKARWNAKADTFGPVTVAVPLSWAGSGPWTQTVAVPGVTAADNGLGVYPVDVADDAARKLYVKAYGCLAAEAETVAGGIVLTCRDGKPETAFQVVVKGVR